MVTAAHSGSGGQPSGTMGFTMPIDTALIVAGRLPRGRGASAVSIGLPGFLGVDVAQSNSANPRQQARIRGSLGCARPGWRAS